MVPIGPNEHHDTHLRPCCIENLERTKCLKSSKLAGKFCSNVTSSLSLGKQDIALKDQGVQSFKNIVLMGVGWGGGEGARQRGGRRRVHIMANGTTRPRPSQLSRLRARARGCISTKP